MTLAIIALALVIITGCSQSIMDEKMMDDRQEGMIQDQITYEKGGNMIKKATFAGGCFWCVEYAFEHEGIEAVSGFTGGEVEDPTYKEVSSGTTGHLEAVQIKYDPKKTSYEELLEIYWKQINPTDGGGQFNDRGYQYSTAIFYHDEEQKRLAEESKKKVEELLGKKVETRIVPASDFYQAEEYHQDYYKKNPIRYKFYSSRSGRYDYIRDVWDKIDEPIISEKPEDLKERLTDLQYTVTQKNGTEPAFKNEYWDNKDPGIYVDVVSGEPLFSSLDKYDSGTGWPSFTKPLEDADITLKEDRKLLAKRTEVRSSTSHLGHVFDDGPEATGQRFCMNSAALRFIHKDDLEKEGYGEFRKLFE